jgi:hypothetical protein
MEREEHERKLAEEIAAAAAGLDSQNDPVVAALREALEDSDPGVRKQAAWALEMIAMKKGQVRAMPRVRARTRMPAGEAKAREDDPNPRER